jgi:sulfatase maturation enzyme AslB (radical SAM superfamily)
LDALWLQVAGTLCNLTCTHCFVSCGPDNHHHPLMSRAEVRQRVAEALDLGVKEFYFTGGEPFLHAEMMEILADTHPHGPCTILTNGTLLTRARVAELRRHTDQGRYSLELRVSLDGWRAARHDRIRGAGSFERALAGLRAASDAGLLPIVTATYDVDDDLGALAARYRAMLRDAGIDRPRLKLLPLFRLGRESERTRPYQAFETLVGVPQDAIEPGRLQCSHCRAVTARGVYVCPLLVEAPGAWLGERLSDSLGPIPLDHDACYTCYVTGMSCGNG